VVSIQPLVQCHWSVIKKCKAITARQILSSVIFNHFKYFLNVIISFCFHHWKVVNFTYTFKSLSLQLVIKKIQFLTLVLTTINPDLRQKNYWKNYEIPWNSSSVLNPVLCLWERALLFFTGAINNTITFQNICKCLSDNEVNSLKTISKTYFHFFHHWVIFAMNIYINIECNIRCHAVILPTYQKCVTWIVCKMLRWGAL
jgi:hypothetical protein